MKKTEAIRLFTTEHALAQALGVSRQAVNQWGDIIPKTRSQEIERLRWQPGSVLAQQRGCLCPDSRDTPLAKHYLYVDERCPIHGFEAHQVKDNAPDYLDKISQP